MHRPPEIIRLADAQPRISREQTPNGKSYNDQNERTGCRVGFSQFFHGVAIANLLKKFKNILTLSLREVKSNNNLYSNDRLLNFPFIIYNPSPLTDKINHPACNISYKSYIW